MCINFISICWSVHDTEMTMGYFFFAYNLKVWFYF
jgi:hypothetical protein